MFSEFVIAKYIRLSLDEAKSGSMSISNQHLILDRHISEMGIPNIKVLEFVDNGYSGMDFERPAVQELLELVRIGAVHCIIVKDMSRFGRNLIDTGYYIEKVFPLYRIRFASVSDGFDSSNYEGGTGGLEIAFKFLMHEYYSLDLSKKIKSAKRAKAMRGELVSKNCAFGFKKTGNRLEIDEPAADTVRLIFDLAIKGLSLASIAGRLYDEKRITPRAYKRNNSPEFPYVWSLTTIHSILSDEQYVGTYTALKTKIMGVGSGKVIEVDESEWVKIPNHHPAIIDKAEFEAAQNRHRRTEKPRQTRELDTTERHVHRGHPLKGKVVCGCCKHIMEAVKTKNATYRCQFTKAVPDIECHLLKVSANDLEAAVLSGILEKAALFAKQTIPCKQQSGHASRHESQIEQIEHAKRTLYERFITGEINVDAYKAEKTIYEEVSTRTKQALTALTKDSAIQPLLKKLSLAATNASAEGLTMDVADYFVEKVLVYPDHKLEIVWKHPEIASVAQQASKVIFQPIVKAKLTFKKC